MKTSKRIPSFGPATTSGRTLQQTTPACDTPVAASLLVAALLSVQTPPAQAVEVYTFESLTLSSAIDGQDRWRDQIGQGQAGVVLDASGNGTKVVYYHKTALFVEPAFLTRTYDASFDFVSFSGTESNAIIQFDATGEHVAMFALGRDLNGDGLLRITQGEFGPAFGVYAHNFRIQEADQGAATDAAFESGNGASDWYRIQLHVDFTAASGEGTGSLYYLNLSDGDTTFQAVAGLQDRSLGLSRLHSEARPARWNAMWLDLLQEGFNAPRADNLIPNLNGIRITELVRVGSDVVLHWRGGVGPYQVQRRASLDAGNWENVGDHTTLMTATAAIVGHTGFFRVVQP
ncbi:MAG: hypothetical protein IT579_11215 [Verrucomicrobia subdivision 3 bacterium]|nr:hypothetical protein [Limisphaerales bacterium]